MTAKKRKSDTTDEKSNPLEEDIAFANDEDEIAEAKAKATVKKGTQSFDVVEDTQEEQVKKATEQELAEKAEADAKAQADEEAREAAILAGKEELPEAEITVLSYQALKNGFKNNYKYVTGLDEVKEALKEDGFYDGPIDTKVTQEVIQAFADFQEAADRKATGIPGVVDLQELGFKVIT